MLSAPLECPSSWAGLTSRKRPAKPSVETAVRAMRTLWPSVKPMKPGQKSSRMPHAASLRMSTLLSMTLAKNASTVLRYIPRFPEAGLGLVVKSIDRCVDILKLAACGILDDFWPGFIGFTEGHSVSMALTAVSTECFAGLFRDVRPAHDDGHPNGADGIGHAVGLGDHASHRADPDKSDVVFEHISGDAGFVHGLRVAVDQENFVAVGSKCLEEKHPKMRHEVAGHTVIGVVKQDSHVRFSS